MTPEQLEGYMKRLNLSYRHNDEPGPNGPPSASGCSC